MKCRSLDQKTLTAISLLYDAALNPNYWEESLDLIAPLIGAKSSALLILETLGTYNYSISKTSSMFSLDVKNTYQEKFSSYEEAHFSNVALSSPGDLVYDADYLRDPASFKRRPDVEYLINQAGVYERFAVRLNSEKAWFDCITFQYSQGRGNIRESERKILQTFIPHIAKAATLSRTYTELRNRYSAVLTILDRLRLGVFIVSSSSDVILKNATAEKLLDQREGLFINSAGKLTANNDASSQYLSEAIVAACNSSKGDEVGGSAKLLLPKSSQKEDYLLDISPLKDTDGELESGLTGALVTVIDIELQGFIEIEGLAKLYQLSSAEEGVAGLIVQGKKYSEMAEIRNVSPETIKTQVNSIMLKTGSSSRSELFARIFKINLPIV